MRAARWMILPLLVGGCAVSGTPISPYGRQVTMEQGGKQVQGELVAISRDTLWVMQRDTLRLVQVAPSQRVAVQRHNFGMRRTLKWLGLAGLGTGVALMVACNSYEASGDNGSADADCATVLPVTVITFGIWGLLFGAGNHWSSMHRLTAADTARLRGFSRYPQGLPESMRVLRLDSMRVMRRDSLRSPN